MVFQNMGFPEHGFTGRLGGRLEGLFKMGSIKFKYAIIATGSKPSILPFANIDKDRVITSTEALKLKEIPKQMIML